MKDTMLSFADASWLSVQVYGIAIVVSMFVALVIKGLVMATSAAAKRNKKPVPQVITPKPIVAAGIPKEVVAAISGALALATGPHRILHIAQSNRSWSSQGRGAQHSHEVKR